MTIRVNGQQMECETGTTLLQLLERMALRPEAVVVERNRAIVRSGEYGATRLDQGDELELLHFVGGG